MVTTNGTAHSAASIDGVVERSNERGFRVRARVGAVQHARATASYGNYPVTATSTADGRAGGGPRCKVTTAPRRPQGGRAGSYYHRS